eukprot:gene6006-2515_t
MLIPHGARDKHRKGKVRALKSLINKRHQEKSVEEAMNARRATADPLPIMHEDGNVRFQN